MMDFVYVYDDAKPEHVKGKTIEDIRITDDCIEIKFTDGSEMEAKLEPVGYEGARINSTYYKVNLPGEET
ncbi:hypothetical protein MKX33_00700 [Paenibacillus sp. FSL R5-0490]|uniref:hypothetical protein n=1 Tax=Paenibacillus sp. FSL R5-0490 TaxID=1920424 RepID=UPI0030D05FCB